MNDKNQIHLGFSNRPHGIKGGFQFKLFNISDSILEKKSLITIFPKDSSSKVDSKGEEYTIANIHFGNKVICYLEGITDRNIVEDLLPFDIYFPRDKFPKLDQGEFYLTDLIGLNVINENGENIGVVESQYDNGVQAVLKIKLKDKSLELPFVENFFPKIDLDQKKIFIIMPEFEE